MVNESGNNTGNGRNPVTPMPVKGTVTAADGIHEGRPNIKIGYNPEPSAG